VGPSCKLESAGKNRTNTWC